MAKSKSKSTPVGQAPISQDPEAVLALEKWCMEQRGRRKVSDLHNSTDEFVKYSSQSLAKKMGLIWDKLWGQGSTGPSDTTEKNLAADALMSAARSGIGIGESTHSNKKKRGLEDHEVSPDESYFESPALYAENENVYQPWYLTFPFTHEGDDGPVDYICVAMGADGMVAPKASVVQEGMVVQVTSDIPLIREKIDKSYKSAQKHYLEAAVDKDKTPLEQEIAQQKYAMLVAQRSAQSKAIRDMKVVKGNNWKGQVTRVVLDQPVEKKIVSFIHHKDSDGEGSVLYIRMKIVEQETHVDALAATSAESPLK